MKTTSYPAPWGSAEPGSKQAGNAVPETMGTLMVRLAGVVERLRVADCRMREIEFALRGSQWPEECTESERPAPVGIVPQLSQLADLADTHLQMMGDRLKRVETILCTGAPQ